MKRCIALIIFAVIPLILTACGETSQNGNSQNESGESVSSTFQIESEPDTSSSRFGSLDVEESSPSPETELNENEETKIEDIVNVDNTPQSGSVPQSSSVPEPAVQQPTSEVSSKEGEKNSAMPSISITVNDSVFSAKLYDNSTARALLERFPMTLNMSELNGNEKYYYLPDSLPTDSQPVGNIQNGDLMLYGSDCLVLFYEGFSTSYSYTKLGYIEDSSGLSTTLGSGGVNVAFSVSN